MADSKRTLFSEFPPVSTETWMEKVTQDLKGADFEKKLVWKTNEGFSVRPFYRADDVEGLAITEALPGEFPYVRGIKKDNNWHVRQDIEVKDPATANKKALDVLQKGVTSLCFIAGKALTASEFDVLLKGIQLDSIELNFRCCIKQAANLAGLLVDYVKQNNINPADVTGSINFDPFKALLVKGFTPDMDLSAAVKAVVEAGAALPNVRVLGANPYYFADAGANCAQELGYGLAYGNAFMQLGIEAGLTPENVAAKIKFNFGVGSNYFMEIAKFRAARLLWAQIVNAYLPEKADRTVAGIKMHAYTTTWNLTTYDAHVNLLRTQTEAMSATIAGVDSLTILPFDSAYETPDEFSERIARNQQLLLKEESHFDKIVDASAGSYYIENLTASLAQAAWSIFLTVDEKGGFLSALQTGYIQQEVNASNDKRHAALSSRREVLLGTNQYPHFNEKALEKMKDETAGTCCHHHDATVPVLNFDRGASAFESLRLATEKSGKRPKVFMLTIGSLSMRLARAQFSSNFFACAGYEIIDNLGFATPEEGIQAARAAKADIVVLCSSDEEYAELAPKAFAALGAGKEIMVVAGAPECMDDLKAIGIKDFINVRSNVLQTLQDFSTRLGIN
ncbi:MAG: methylmalonyl-CoA mutase small subunit [Bacteroidales bacterium]|nr:methylmalonyl-CoA mutase small subunit [Bacteroidales bacterium]